MSVANVNGADLVLEERGSGEPILLMHGGLGLDHSSLTPWHDALAHRARLIYYDHRWNGRSDRIGPADFETWQSDAAGLLDHLGIARATIFGHSYGAWIALAFAARYPERVDRLILCGASPAFDYAPDLSRQEQTNPAAVKALLAGLATPPATDDELRELWRTILPLYFETAPPPELLARTHCSAAGYAYSSAALASYNVVASLPAMTMPMLILVGAHDFITPPAQAHRIAALAPHATVVELPRSGHFPFIEERDAYLAAIESWLDANPQPSRT